MPIPPSKHPLYRRAFTKKYRQCKAEGCEKWSSYGPPDSTTKKSHCVEHAPTGYISKTQRIQCAEDECKLRGFYGKSDRKVLYCSQHKPTGYISIDRRVCSYRQCNKTAYWYLPNNSKAFYCADHKSEEAFNRNYRKCQEFGCHHNATNRERTHCSGHLSTGSHNPYKKACEVHGCTTYPSFGLPGFKKPLRCKFHRNDTDVDVANARCLQCHKQPVFGLLDDRKRLWCVDHKEVEAINLSHPICLECSSTASYGYPGEGKIYCAQHRIAGTIFQPNKQCIIYKCRNRAEFGISKHEHCEDHKIASEMNLVNRKCASCGLYGALNRHEQCETCNPELYLHKLLYKQKIVTNYLDFEGLRPDCKDRILDRGICGKERPDLFYENNNQPHTLIIEIDEVQHKNYDCSRFCTCNGSSCNCDITRMKNIQQGQGGRPGYFIRFNPDDYKTPQKQSKVGDLGRLQNLQQWVRYLLITPPTGFLQVVYLYYDNFNDDAQIETIVPWDVEG